MIASRRSQELLLLFVVAQLHFRCSSGEHQNAFEQVREVRRQLLAAEQEFANGSAEAWKKLCSQDSTATLFGGAGGAERGWTQVGPRYDWAASAFAGGKVETEILSLRLATDLAVTIEREKWLVRLKTTGDTATITLRVTHVFRRENGTWKLMHRHADPATSKGTIESMK